MKNLFMRSHYRKIFKYVQRTVRIWLFVLLSLPILGIVGCSTQHYRERADEEAYSLIDEKEDSVEEMPGEFSVEAQEKNILQDLPRKPDARQPEESEPYAAESEENEAPRLVDLDTAMKVAAVNSREFQDRREAVFLAALSLSLQRDRFNPTFSGIISGDVTHQSGNDAQTSAEGEFGFRRLLKTGAQFSLDFSTVLSAYLTGDPREAASSLLNLSLTQPLLRGRGITVVEPLTQAERNLVYEMRRFARFRRTFFTQIYSEYFDVLQQRQVVRNEKLNLENLRRARERAEEMFDAGRLPGFQVDQTRQDELRAEDRLERAQQRYHRTLDQFKTTLGIKPDTEIVLQMKELQEMQDAARPTLPWSREKAVEIALNNRLDLKTAREQVADARRKVKVAANDLKPGLDVTLEAGGSTKDDKQPLSFSDETDTYSAGLELDLPVERTAERNEYRRRLIKLEAAVRNAEETRDRIITEIRQAWRNYFRAWESYRIQKNSVELAQERVDSTTMLLNAGRASTRDMLEARESFIQAKNSLSQALVEYKVSKLNLSRDLGTLTLTETYEMKSDFQSYPKKSRGGNGEDE